MDKHEKELIILERIVKEQKQAAKIGMVIGIPVALLFGCAAIPSLFSGCETALAVLCSFLFVCVIITFLVFNYRMIEKDIPKMRAALGAATDEEFEEILENCQRITNTIFINNRHLINFDNSTVIELSDIKNCKTFTAHGDDSTDYCITIKCRNGNKDTLSFSRESARDIAYKMISTAADFAEGQKYID